MLGALCTEVTSFPLSILPNLPTLIFHDFSITRTPRPILSMTPIPSNTTQYNQYFLQNPPHHASLCINTSVLLHQKSKADQAPHGKIPQG
jgi:hypothetical protein